MKYYRQCELKRENHTMISWIPEKYAKMGKILKVKVNQNWENGWKVSEVYNRKSESSVIRDSMLFDKMRQVTDI